MTDAFEANPQRWRALHYAGSFTSRSRNNAGRSATIEAGKRVTLLEVEGSADNGEMLTATLGPSMGRETIEGAVIGAPKLYGIVQWGSDGGSSEIEVDWKNGTTISVPASYLRVSCVSEETSEPAIVSAFVGYGTRPGLSSPTRTLDSIDDFFGMGTPGLRIPRMASHVSVFPVATSLDKQYSVFFADRSLTPIPYASGKMDGSSPIPIPNAARFMAVYSVTLNPLDISPIQFSAVFSLSL